MYSGMLWFDNDPKTGLTKKIHRAVQYYQKKYGQTPNLCTVNPKMLEQENLEGADLKVETSDQILPFHFWIGRTVEK